MAHSNQYHSVISEAFFKPLLEHLAGCVHQRECPTVSDAWWLELGVRRCLAKFQSGRDFLQDLSERHDVELEAETYFDTLRSDRRLALINVAEWKRKAKTLEETKEFLEENGHSLPWIYKAIQRITQRSVKFIR